MSCTNLMKKCCDDIDGGIFFSLSAAETLRDSEGGVKTKIFGKIVMVENKKSCIDSA